MPHFEQTLSSETLFEGRVIRVTLDKVRLENGRTSTREVVHHHGGAGVAALNEKGEIYLVRQYRYALGRELIEIPAGKLEKGKTLWRLPGASWVKRPAFALPRGTALGLSFPHAATAVRSFICMLPPGLRLWASIWTRTNSSACSRCL